MSATCRETKVSAITRIVFFLIKKMPGDRWISALEVSFCLSLFFFFLFSSFPSFPLCGLFWPWLFDNFKENFFFFLSWKLLVYSLDEVLALFCSKEHGCSRRGGKKRSHKGKRC